MPSNHPSQGQSNPTRRWRAPGRVNIIGEHIDYLGGTVLPFACDLELRLDGDVVLGGDVALRSQSGSAEPFVDGVRRALADDGVGVVGFDGTISSTIPVGAGLSSSSALTAALAFALSDGKRPTPELLLRAERY